MIKGITVKLIKLVEIGKDEFNSPINEEKEILVDNVLIAPISSQDVINQQNLKGKKAIYTLAIPKKDNNTWSGCYVEFFNKRWYVFSEELQGIDALIPLRWNKKVMVENYEEV